MKLARNMRLEDQLLLCCARTQMAPDIAEQVRALLRADLEWDDLFSSAQRHGMLPLLYWHCQTLWPESVSCEPLQRLQQNFQYNALWNLFLTEELGRILQLFEAHGIAAIPFKGPVLATAVYGNLDLRQFTDLDILLHKPDVRRAKELLATRGYRHRHALTHGQERALLKYEYHYSLKRDGGCLVELHWGFAQRYFAFPLDPDPLWQRAATTPLGGTPVRTLAPEDLLLILSVHGARHYWERLMWICDLAELLRVYPDMAWANLLERAARLGSLRMLLLGLFLASEWLGALLPEDLSQRVRTDRTVQTLACRVHERLFQEDRFLSLGHKIAARCFYLRLRERPRDQIAYGLRALRHLLIPNEADRDFLRIPGSLSLLYYAFRPLRLLMQFGRQAWQHRHPLRSKRRLARDRHA